ncbi:hypothetical protein BJ741DRAFT_665670 [Chytriomyces cf. hyalinus JEL632]|nr:hypothetical protein BJ741DRAFT_665670 [Chytriomyces cf. hyalinus JEL632]
MQHCSVHTIHQLRQSARNNEHFGVGPQNFCPPSTRVGYPDDVVRAKSDLLLKLVHDISISTAKRKNGKNHSRKGITCYGRNHGMRPPLSQHEDSDVPDDESRTYPKQLHGKKNSSPKTHSPFENNDQEDVEIIHQESLFRKVFPKKKRDSEKLSPFSDDSESAEESMLDLDRVEARRIPNVVDVSPSMDVPEFGPVDEYPRPVYFESDIRADGWAMSGKLLNSSETEAEPSKYKASKKGFKTRSNDACFDPTDVQILYLQNAVSPVPPNPDAEYQVHTHARASLADITKSSGKRSKSFCKSTPSIEAPLKNEAEPQKPPPQRVLLRESAGAAAMRRFPSSKSAKFESRVAVVHPPTVHALPEKNKNVTARKSGIGRGASWKEGKMHVTDVGVWIKLADKTAESVESQMLESQPVLKSKADLSRNQSWLQYTTPVQNVRSFNSLLPVTGQGGSTSCLTGALPRTRSSNSAAFTECAEVEERRLERRSNSTPSMTPKMNSLDGSVQQTLAHGAMQSAITVPNIPLEVLFNRNIHNLAAASPEKSPNSFKIRGFERLSNTTPEPTTDSIHLHARVGFNGSDPPSYSSPNWHHLTHIIEYDSKPQNCKSQTRGTHQLASPDPSEYLPCDENGDCDLLPERVGGRSNELHPSFLTLRQNK